MIRITALFIFSCLLAHCNEAGNEYLHPALLTLCHHPELEDYSIVIHTPFDCETCVINTSKVIEVTKDDYCGLAFGKAREFQHSKLIQDAKIISSIEWNFIEDESILDDIISLTGEVKFPLILKISNSRVVQIYTSKDISQFFLNSLKSNIDE